MSSIERFYVLLELEIDTARSITPINWDFGALLEMSPDESVDATVYQANQGLDVRLRLSEKGMREL
ncbi:hypothetical protein C8C94_5053 [Acidovorax sp. 94]|jgi:hypothetical protein|uniref:hypothetical protein n=1 Tax=Acidovorax sp. 94 TaxID=2135633 RepID=UPI000EB4FF77|nr:hypothetical protein [Acidovorax sp. 94]RKR52863.1 hypothetical protein C8C94_5053 [Acidovorax sp. 94]